MSEEKKSIIDHLKERAGHFFSGDEGSVFWLIRVLIQFVKDLVAGINAWLDARRAEKRLAREVNNDSGLLEETSDE